MNREVHVRFWERAGVKFLRATRHTAWTGSRRGRSRGRRWGTRTTHCLVALEGQDFVVSLGPQGLEGRILDRRRGGRGHLK